MTKVTGKAWKLARPYFGPYRVLTLTPTKAYVQLVHDSKSESIFVALDRIRCCYDEMPDDVWMGHSVSPIKTKGRSNVTRSIPTSTPLLIKIPSLDPWVVNWQRTLVCELELHVCKLYHLSFVGFVRPYVYLMICAFIVLWFHVDRGQTILKGGGIVMSLFVMRNILLCHHDARSVVRAMWFLEEKCVCFELL